MGLFSNNKFNTEYKKRPFDSYKSIVSKLDEETKQKLDKQRQKGMLIVVVFLVILVILLAVTGIGIDKSRSVSGNVFADKEHVLIECFGDSLTEGFTVTPEGVSGIVEDPYPEVLEAQLPGLFREDGNSYSFKSLEVDNFGQSGSVLQKNSSSRLSGKADIVIIQYTANNFITGAEYEGILEENIDAVRQAGSQVFLLNYPYVPGTPQEDKLKQANNYIASAAEKSETKLLDVHSHFESAQGYGSELFCSDGMHLTQKGYELLGEYIAKEIHQYYFSLF